jgi:chemotaxis protein methyltransferase CheR
MPSDPRPATVIDSVPRIDDDEFDAIRSLLFDLAGISIGSTKQDLVCARLARRLRQHGLTSYGDYYRLLREQDPTGAERQEFINCLTTNKTDFYREPHHFDFLRDTVVPRAKARAAAGGPKRLRVWCAASSTGEEPYTLALTLAEHLPRAEGWDVRILASDIDTAVLATAARGVYDAHRVEPVPPDLLHKYFLRGTGANAGRVAVRRELTDLLTFRQINLAADAWPIQTRFDAIFCRNVMIYFNRETQRRVMEQFARHLAADGYLFLGHSENVYWMSHLFTSIGGTGYQLRDAQPAPAPVRPPARARPPKGDDPAEAIARGEAKAARGPSILQTRLGACVAACIFDPETGVGGMNTFSLPGPGEDGANRQYGAYAMELLITAVLKRGGDRSRLRAKVFGGANVLSTDSGRPDVGARTAAFVRDYMAAEGIPIAAECLGGSRGLVVRFHVASGKAMVRPLTGGPLTELVRDEMRYAAEVAEKITRPDPGAIELFCEPTL